MKRSIVVMNKTGGQGKTLTSQMIYLGYRDAGLNPRLAAADTTGDEDRSKLGKFFPGAVHELGLGVRLTDIRRNQGAAIAYWDRLGELLLQGGYIIDIGANVAPFVFDWARSRDAGRILRHRNAPPIVLCISMRPQAQAVEDALHILERSVAEVEFLPVAAQVLVQNECGGSFEGYGSSDDFQRFSALKRSHDLRIAAMSQNYSELWPIAERNYLPLHDLLTAELEDLERDYGLDAFAASGAQADLVQWVDETLTSFRSVGLVPPPAATRSDSLTAGIA